MKTIQNVLRKIQLFAFLSDQDLARIADIIEERNVAAREMIIEQNTTGNEMFIISSGSVEVFLQARNRHQVLLNLGEGQLFGEMALLDEGYRSASVRATAQGCTLYVIDREAFNKLCDMQNHIGYIVMRNLALDLVFKLRHRNLADM